MSYTSSSKHRQLFRAAPSDRAAAGPRCVASRLRDERGEAEQSGGTNRIRACAHLRAHRDVLNPAEDGKVLERPRERCSGAVAEVVVLQAVAPGPRPHRRRHMSGVALPTLSQARVSTY